MRKEHQTSLIYARGFMTASSQQKAQTHNAFANESEANCMKHQPKNACVKDLTWVLNKRLEGKAKNYISISQFVLGEILCVRGCRYRLLGTSGYNGTA